MPHGRLYPERSAQERRAEFGDQFLARIVLQAERIEDLAREPGRVARGVGQLVQRGAVIVDLLEKAGCGGTCTRSCAGA